MSWTRPIIALAIGLGAGVGGSYWFVHSALKAPDLHTKVSVADRTVLYYRDPIGAPEWSATPKKTADGKDYMPVYEDEEPAAQAQSNNPSTSSSSRKILYYRNPMGLLDTSPVPKKDSMGMDYIPVYDGDDQGDGTTVRVSLDKIQRSGVRTETVQTRVIVHPVRGVGTAKTDETRQTVVAMRSEGYIEDLFVSRTGEYIEKGEPLFRVYSAQIQSAQTDLLSALRSQSASTAGANALEGARQRLRNLGVPEARIREIQEQGVNPRTIDWPAPASGHIVEKRIVNGQRVMPGEELYRIADHSHIWVVADVSEADMGAVGVGTRALVTFRAYPEQHFQGEVTLVYPELKSETRTGRVRLELPNPDERLKIDMYADVVFQGGRDKGPVPAVPDSAIIDSGTRQVVLIARGEGRFEPRVVKIGQRGEGYVEIINGVKAGEEIVTSATFLIDAESNLKAALRAFSEQDNGK